MVSLSTTQLGCVNRAQRTASTAPRVQTCALHGEQGPTYLEQNRRCCCVCASPPSFHNLLPCPACLSQRHRLYKHDGRQLRSLHCQVLVRIE